MASEQDKKILQSKISREFASRLEQLEPDEKVRAILMLETNKPKSILRRPTKTARRASLKTTRESVAKVLPDIDRILKRYHGKRLKGGIDALSAIPIITTAAGIDALTGSEHVKAILEDQALFRVA